MPSPIPGRNGDLHLHRRPSTALGLALLFANVVAAGASSMPMFEFPRPIEFRGDQIVLDEVDTSGLGAGTVLTFRVKQRDRTYRKFSTDTDERGRFTIALDATGLFDRDSIRVTIERNGMWVKWLPTVRQDFGAPGPAASCVPSALLTNLEPELCACESCGPPVHPVPITFSYEALVSGVNAVDGTVIGSLPVLHFETRLLDFDFTLFHHTMKSCDGPVGHAMSHSFDAVIVQAGSANGKIVTPDLRVFPILRADGEASGASEEWVLPVGFFSRLRRDARFNRWFLTHHAGVEFEFVVGVAGQPGPLIAMREPNGNRAEVRRDPSGALASVLTDLGQEVRFAYDFEGRMSSVTDHVGRSWSFGYDARGNLNSIMSPRTEFADIGAGAEITEASLALSSVLVRRGRVTRLTYGDPILPHQLTRITDERGAVPVEYTYYHEPPNAGRVATKRVNGREIRFFYDPPADSIPAPLPPLELTNTITRVIDREGNVTDYEMHGPVGGPIQGEGAFGLRRQVQWTERGKGNPPLRAGGSATVGDVATGEPLYWERRWLQDCACLAPKKVTQPFRSDDILTFDTQGMPVGYPTEIYEYNDRRQVTGYEYRGRQGESIRWQKSYDSFEHYSRLLGYLEPRSFDAEPIYADLDFFHSYEYDEAGNLLTHNSPTVTRGVEAPQAIRETWTYDGAGQRLIHTDPNGNVTRFDYFAGSSSGGDINTRGLFGGYLATVTRGAAGSADSATELTTRFRVNALGMVTETTDPRGLVHAREYNALGETTREIDPEVTLANGVKAQHERRFVYDGAGNLVMERRRNLDFDGTVLPGEFIDRSESFDAVGNLLSTRIEIDNDDTHDLVTRYAYDGNDQQIAMKRPEGNRTFRVYDERQLLFKTFEGVAPGGQPSASYPADKRALDLGGTPFVSLTVEAYDARRNRVERRDGRALLARTFYDFNNRRVAERDPGGNGKSWSLDDASNVLTEQSGAVSTAGGLSEPLARTYHRYDENGRRYQTVRDIELVGDEGAAVDPDDGAGSSFRTVFDAGGRVAIEIDAEGNATASVFDGANRRVEVTDALGNGVAYSYDADSNILRVDEREVPGPGAAGPPEVYSTLHVYDALNRRRETHVLGSGGDAHTTLYAYDSRHNLRRLEDAEARVTLSTFDDADRMIRAQRFAPGPGGGPAVELTRYEYAYDGNGNEVEQRAFTDLAGGVMQVTRYDYDALDRVVRAVYPDSEGDADTVELSYDQNSNVTAIRDQRGVRLSHTYDESDRLTVQMVAHPPSIPGTERQEYEYDALDRLQRARNEFAEVSLRYDALSRPTSEGQAVRLDGSGFARGYEGRVALLFAYDRQSNRTSLEVLDESSALTAARQDFEVRWSRDALNRVVGVEAAYFDRPLRTVASYAYLGPQRVQAKRLANGAFLAQSYDSKRRVSSASWRHGPAAGALLAGFEYSYDRRDHPLFELVQHDRRLADNFAYDGRDEIAGVDYRRPEPTDYREREEGSGNAFLYDGNLNRTAAIQTDSFGGNLTTASYTANQANEYTEIAIGGAEPAVFQPLADANGNMTRFPARPSVGGSAGRLVELEAAWDAFNLLFSAEVPDAESPGGRRVEHYRYDPLGRRIARFDLVDDACAECPSPRGRRYIWDGWHTVEERALIGSAPDRLERITIHNDALDEPLLAAIDGDGDRSLGGASERNRPGGTDFEYYLLTNRMGSVVALLDAARRRRVLEYYRYEVYGEVMVLPVVDRSGSTAGPDGVEDTPLDLTDNHAAMLAARATDPSAGRVSRFGNAYTFTARNLDETTGLIYFRNRYYEPHSGRFVSRDPLGYIDGLNLMAYAVNQPTRYTDPLGFGARVGVAASAEFCVDFCTGDWKLEYSIWAGARYKKWRFSIGWYVEARGHAAEGNIAAFDLLSCGGQCADCCEKSDFVVIGGFEVRAGIPAEAHFGPLECGLSVAFALNTFCNVEVEGACELDVLDYIGGPIAGGVKKAAKLLGADPTLGVEGSIRLGLCQKEDQSWTVDSAEICLGGKLELGWGH